MKLHNKISLFLGTICLLASLVAIYSIIQILNADTRIEESLKQIDAQDKIIIPVSTKLVDIEKKQVEKQSKSPYTNRPDEGALFGKIIIPSIDLEAPIIEGTEDEQLDKGVGHYVGSVLPGEWDNTVLAGHRDTVFKELGEVEIGDKIVIKTTAGTFTYQITEQRIVDADDRTVIVPYEDPVLTLVTCYPFDFIGPAPKRYILSGKLLH